MPATCALALVLVGFGEAEITPPLVPGKPVYMAGFGQNRVAAAVHDPLMARASSSRRGAQDRPPVHRRGGLLPSPTSRTSADGCRLSSTSLVSSTHNHEGPDTLGLWGPGPFTSGIDKDYLRLVEDRIVGAVQAADAALRPATAHIGTVTAPELLHDSRPPVVKHDELVALEFRDAESDKPVGILVQWNCHPETLDSKKHAAERRLRRLRRGRGPQGEGLPRRLLLRARSAG